MATWTNYDYDNIYTQADGTKIFLDLKEWCEFTLTGSNLAEWEADLLTILAYEDPLVAAGTMAIGPMVTTVTIGDRSYNTVQGKLIVLESDTDSAPSFHTLWDKWILRIKADANVTWIDYTWKLGNFLS